MANLLSARGEVHGSVAETIEGSPQIIKEVMNSKAGDLAPDLDGVNVGMGHLVISRNGCLDLLWRRDRLRKVGSGGMPTGVIR
jgi:hypothetical protein